MWSSWAPCWAQEILRCDQFSAFKTKMNWPWEGWSEGKHVHALSPEPGTWEVGPEQTEVRSLFWTRGEFSSWIKSYLGRGEDRGCRGGILYFSIWGWAMCVCICFVSEVVGITSRSSLLVGETQATKVVCLTHRGGHWDHLPSSCTPTYSLIGFRLKEIPHYLEFRWFGSRLNFHLSSRQVDGCLGFRSCALWLQCCVFSCHFNGFLELSGIQPTGLIFNIGQKKNIPF